MLPPELADRRLDLSGDLMRTAVGTSRSIGERDEAALLVAGDPVVDRLARHPEALGDLDHLPAILHDRENGLVPLLHDAELHQHRPTSLPRTGAGRADGPMDRCQASAGATVKDQPELVSNMSRSSVNHEVVPERPG
jgi:hypothetical protein